MDLPKDPFMLLSLVNMKLRDFYSSLDDMCDDLGVSKNEINNILNSAGFEYDENLNKFF